MTVKLRPAELSRVSVEVYSAPVIHLTGLQHCKPCLRINWKETDLGGVAKYRGGNARQTSTSMPLHRPAPSGALRRADHGPCHRPLSREPLLPQELLRHRPWAGKTNPRTAAATTCISPCIVVLGYVFPAGSAMLGRTWRRAYIRPVGVLMPNPDDAHGMFVPRRNCGSQGSIEVNVARPATAEFDRRTS